MRSLWAMRAGLGTWDLGPGSWHVKVCQLPAQLLDAANLIDSYWQPVAWISYLIDRQGSGAPRLLGREGG